MYNNTYIDGRTWAYLFGLDSRVGATGSSSALDTLSHHLDHTKHLQIQSRNKTKPRPCLAPISPHKRPPTKGY